MYNSYLHFLIHNNFIILLLLFEFLKEKYFVPLSTSFLFSDLKQTIMIQVGIIVIKYRKIEFDDP